MTLNNRQSDKKPSTIPKEFLLVYDYGECKKIAKIYATSMEKARTMSMSVLSDEAQKNIQSIFLYEVADWKYLGSLPQQIFYVVSDDSK